MRKCRTTLQLFAYCCGHVCTHGRQLFAGQGPHLDTRNHPHRCTTPLDHTKPASITPRHLRCDTHGTAQQTCRAHMLFHVRRCCYAASRTTMQPRRSTHNAARTQLRAPHFTHDASTITPPTFAQQYLHSASSLSAIAA